MDEGENLPPAPATATATEDQKAAVAAKFKSLELLYDYTKFHIGAYLTLTSAYITVATVKVGGSVACTGAPERLLNAEPHLRLLAVAFFALAGFAGGVIVSSITQWEGGSAQAFLKTKLGPWDGEKIQLSGKTWAKVEHTSFWLGLFAAVASVLF